MSSPDYISPIVGYRVWTWGTMGLKSLCGVRWHPNQSLAAKPACFYGAGGLPIRY